jgi:hypothetical protein
MTKPDLNNRGRKGDEARLYALEERDRGTPSKAIAERLGTRPEYVRALWQRIDADYRKSEAAS